MPDVPAPARGLLYPTHVFSRCPSFVRCIRCQQCSARNTHLVQCAICEKKKTQVCSHNDKQKMAVVMLEEAFGRPMFHPSYEPQKLNMKDTIDSNQKMTDAIAELGVQRTDG